MISPTFSIVSPTLNVNPTLFVKENWGDIIDLELVEILEHDQLRTTPQRPSFPGRYNDSSTNVAK